jgi:D-sedoheptulose 7-phosphate isomerase
MDRGRAFALGEEGMMDGGPTASEIFANAIADHCEVVRRLDDQRKALEAIARAMVSALHGGGKILWCGNGGSAAESQHMAAEIVGRFRRERRAFPSIALTTDTSTLTAIANDYGFESVFARQVEALGVSGDVLVGISTSGNSRNVIAALEAARALGMTTVAFTGAGGGKLAALADHLLAVDSRDTARIQEAHNLAGHMICDWIELDWVASQPADEPAAGAAREGAP